MADFLNVTIDVNDAGGILSGSVEQHLGEAERDPSYMEAVGRLAREAMLLGQWNTEGGMLGAPWPDNAPDYAVWKQQVFGSTEIGVRTGATKQAATSKSLSAVTETWTGILGKTTHTVTATPILDATPDEVTVGVEATEDGNPYASHFDFGHPVFGAGELPREFDQMASEVLKIQYLEVMHKSNARIDERASSGVDVYLREAGIQFGG